MDRSKTYSRPAPSASYTFLGTKISQPPKDTFESMVFQLGPVNGGICDQSQQGLSTGLAGWELPSTVQLHEII